MSLNRPCLSRRGLLGATAAAAGLAAAGMRPQTADAAAPKLGPVQASFHRFAIGDFEVTTILDGALPRDDPHSVFGVNVAAEEVYALAEQNFLPSDQVVIGFTPVVVNTENELIVFDSGLGAGARPGGGRLAASLRTAGFTADQFDVVVVTHFHPDHIGGLMEDGQPLFPNARYVTNQVEYDFWSTDDKLSGPTEAVAKLTQANIVPFAETMTFIKDGGQVVPGIEAIEAFGHTPGHTAFHLESGGDRLVITADTANHAVFALQRPEWYLSFDMDKDTAVQSRKKVFGMLAADRVPFTGYHMPFPSVGYVEQSGDGFRYVPASYQLDL